jgi:tryptophanyl-tRNA synthetase
MPESSAATWAELSRMRIFSGIQPTGAKHLGNYVGAIRQWVASQDEGDQFICVVDLHSITVAYEPDELKESTLALAALLFASGLEPDRCTLFVQSHNPDHPEAAWLLNAVASFGELRRMTQFKEKAEQQEFVSSGVFTYPVLQAADILLYQTDLVPVGEDQRQHLEFARNIAQRFNARFGDTFKVPAYRVPEVGARIMNLQEPENRMSTTAGTPQGTLRLLDAPDEIRKKFKTAVTDSGTDIRYARDEKPGISNLLEIMSAATGEPIPSIEARYDGAGYGQFKTDVAESVLEMLAPIQARYRELRDDQAELQRLLAVGAEKARASSAPTLALMYERMGFAR